jgi:hypothetical protein
LLLLIGNGETELADSKKRDSFELFRSGLHDIEVITFDELFRKIKRSRSCLIGLGKSQLKVVKPVESKGATQLHQGQRGTDTKHGKFMSEKDAIAQGYRASRNGQ